jgi:hypothetical protein
VLPEKKKDFTEDLQEINTMLATSHDEVVLKIIRDYEENF